MCACANMCVCVCVCVRECVRASVCVCVCARMGMYVLCSVRPVCSKCEIHILVRIRTHFASVVLTHLC